MQCVSSSSNFAWHQCYQLLLQAVEGYNIALDPRDSIAGRSCCYNNIAGRSCCYNNIAGRSCCYNNIAGRSCCYNNIAGRSCCYNIIAGRSSCYNIIAGRSCCYNIRPVYPYGFAVIPTDSDLKFRCYPRWVKNYGHCPIFPFPHFKLE